MTDYLIAFVRESNRIEGICREPTDAELIAHEEFLMTNLAGGPAEVISALIRLVSVLQPNAVLRDRPGLDVRVGKHFPPPGGLNVLYALEHLFDGFGAGPDRAYSVHRTYENIHPFTDGNGRSGRALWLHMMGGPARVPLGFLHTWYYQSLDDGDRSV